VVPRAVDGICVGVCTLINDASTVVNGAVRVTYRVDISVRFPQQSLMTVVPGSSQSKAAVKVSAVLSGTGTSNV
jgi:hypothetical protein